MLDELDGWEADWQPNLNVGMGVIRNETEGGPFDKSFMRCIGQDAMAAGKYLTNGSCTETDAAGDKIFITYNAESFTFAGGTGKYKGITGGGTIKFETVFQGGKIWAGIASLREALGDQVILGAGVGAGQRRLVQIAIERTFPCGATASSRAAGRGLTMTRTPGDLPRGGWTEPNRGRAKRLPGGLNRFARNGQYSRQ